MDFWRRFRRNRAAVFGLGVVGLFGLVALLAPALASVDPFAISRASFQPPGEAYLMGTDALGRDVFSQLVHGARVSLTVGLLAAAVAIAIGIVVGATSGFYGGRLDAVLMRITEMFQVMPRFILALVVVALLGGGLDRIIAVIGILSWPPAARLVRAQFLSLKEQEFVEAARSIGVSRPRIVVSEILPNALPPAIVAGSLDVAQAILLEASLSFLGLGDPNAMSWGTMLQEAQRYLRQAWWLSAFPGAAVFLTVLGFNLVGDGLNDALNPRLRER
jgi:peptide/nickel transport system permease protein